MIGVVHVSGRSVGGHSQQRNAKTVNVSRAPAVALAGAVGRDMIVPATPIVPGDENSGVFPVDLTGLAAAGFAADGVHDSSDPGWSAAIGAASVVGLGSVGNHPAYCWELAVLDVAENRRWRHYHVVHPVVAGTDEFPVLLFRNTHVLDSVGSGPDGAGGWRVVLA